MTANSSDGENLPMLEQEGEKIFPLNPTGNELCTVQLRKFLKLHHTAWDFFFFGVELAHRADSVRITAVRALAGGGDERYADDLRKIENDPQPAQDKLNSFSSYQSDNMVIRVVNNFLSYLAEIIQEAIRRQPKILMSEETVRVEDILRFTKYSDLVGYLVEKKINSLSYSSIRDIEKFVRKRTGLDLFASEDERTLLILSIELRNIYTHNRGVVSDTTLRRLSGLDHRWILKKGERFGTDFDELTQLSNNLVKISRRLDSGFAPKFKIKRRRYDTYEKKFVAQLELRLKSIRIAKAD